MEIGIRKFCKKIYELTAMAFLIGILFFIFLLNPCLIPAKNIPSTLDGPFDPVTVPYDASLRGTAVDIPDTDPRVRRRVSGFEPEQISVSLSSNYDSVWISWITGSVPLFRFYSSINRIRRLILCMTDLQGNFKLETT